MSMMDGQHSADRKDEQAAIQKIIAAKEEGRKIVPFLGAGISASSGFPLVDSIRHYLLKVRYFVQYGAYRDALGLPTDISSAIEDPESAKVPEQNPSRYLTDFGWPNPNQLNSDLHRVTGLVGDGDPAFADLKNWITPVSARTTASREAERARRDAAHALHLIAPESAKGNEHAWIDRHVAKTFESQLETFRARIESSSRPGGKKVDWHDELRKLKRLYTYAEISRTRFAKWGRPRWRIMTAALFAQLEDIRLYDQRLAEAIEEQIWQLELAPTTDWSRHLMQLAEGNLNLIDALFSMLGLRYAPGLSHRMMAQLVKGLNLSLLLTINFDPYLEEALMEEGITPRVLDVSRDDDPPDVTVVKQAMSIIKLHGSSHSIRLGERLDYALDDDTRHRVERFVGDDALLLILGFSGYERRMMQLIDHLATRSGPGEQLRVLWMHFEAEDRLPATLIDFERRLADQGKSDRFFRSRLSDAGEFLFHVYQRAMGGYPRVRVPVTILPKRVVELPELPESPTDVRPTDRGAYERNLRHLQEIPVQLFVEKGLLANAASDDPIGHQNVGMLESSRHLSRFVQQKSGYQLIWIDLEEHHTVAGVITEIIDRMRVFDPDLSPLILPVEKSASKTRKNSNTAKARFAADLFTKPIRFLKRALRRGRYLLAFDSLEDFGREQTSHHGLPSEFSETDNKRKEKLLSRVDDLLLFLSTLLEVNPIEALSNADDSIWNLDWYCAIACSVPEPRHDTSGPRDLRNGVVADVYSKLRQFVSNVVNTDDGAAAIVLEGSSNTRDIIRYKRDEKQRIVLHRMPWPDAKDHQPPSREELLGRLTSAPDAKDLALWIAGGGDAEDNAVVELQQGVIDGKISEFFKGLWTRPADADGSSLGGWLSSSPLLPFLTLTITRRPRSYVGIRTLWNEYLSPDWKVSQKAKKGIIDQLLESLEAGRVLKAMPGGFYWIPHRLHRKAYKLLSAPVRRKSLEKEGKPSSLFQRTAFLIMIHGRLARFYYLHIFSRTRDANAMFEYLYHRITCLKYLASLCDMTGDSKNHLNASPTNREEISLACHALLHMDGHIKDRPANDENLHEHLIELRERWLQALTNVFDREREMLLSQGSADTWLAWIEQILETDADRLVASTETQPSLRRLRERLEGKLEDLQATLLREKRDWEECANRRIDHLANWCAAIATKLNTEAHPIVYKHLRRMEEDQEHRRRFLAAWIWSLQSDASIAPFSFTELVKEVLAARAEWDPAELMEGTERLLQCLEDLARCIHHDPWMSIVGEHIAEVESVKPTGNRVPEKLLEVAGIIVDELRKHALQPRQPTAGTDACRPFLAMTQAWEVKVLFEKERLKFGDLSLLAGGVTEALKLQLEESCQQLERARHRTRGFDSISPIEFPLSRSRLRTLQAQMLINLDRSREARATLSHAETGLTEETMQQRFQLAVVAEFRAQTWMKEADRTLDDCEKEESQPNATVDRELPSKKAAGHRDEAVQALREAERLLQRGRRNAGQWLRLYTAKAQLEIENLLLMLFDMDGDLSSISIDRELHFRAKLFNTLQRGLEAIRGGWDCVQAPAHRGRDSYSSRNRSQGARKETSLVKRERSPWLAKWAQLMMTGHLVLHRYSRVAMVQKSTNEKSNKSGPVDLMYEDIVGIDKTQKRIASLEDYKSLWKALNKSVSLDQFVEEARSHKTLAKWESLLESGIHYGNQRIEESVRQYRQARPEKGVAWRQVAKDIVEKMVFGQGRADQPCGDAAFKLHERYEIWREFRILGGLDDPTPSREEKPPGVRRKRRRIKEAPGKKVRIR